MSATAGEAWQTTTTPAELARWLAGKRSVVVLSHIKPDGDALGSSLAITRALNIAAGGAGSGFSGVASRAETWHAGPIPPWAGAIVRDTKMRRLEGPDPALPVGEPDAIVITDTGSWAQLEHVEEWLRARQDRAVVIDHHLKGDADVAPRRIVEPGAAAACELCAEVCRLVLGVGSVRELPEELAEPLYLGIATDTGWFRHSNTTPRVMRLAADLIEAGARQERLFELIEQRDRPSRLRLLARALDSMELLDDGRLALLTLRQPDFEAAGAGPGESGGFLDFVKAIETVRVAAILTETPGENGRPSVKISLRSKGGPAMVDVNVVAAALGGGGHAQAAGARLDGTLEDARGRLLEALG